MRRPKSSLKVSIREIAARKSTTDTSFIVRISDFLHHSDFVIRHSAMLVLAALVAITSGCSRAGAPQATMLTSPTPLTSNSVLRVHWIGKQKVGVTASAYSFMRVWNQLYSRQYEATFLEQLASAPWRLITNRPASQTAPIPEVVTMLEHALNEESCLEIRRTFTGEQIVFAIRLDKLRAANWERGLANVVSSLEGNYPLHKAGGWSVRGQSSGKQFDLELVGNWLVCGIATGTNTLFQEITARTAREQIPFTITTNSHWLALEADSRWVAEHVGATIDSNTDMPKISLLLSGNGANAVATGELVFKQPLGIELEPWTFPKSQVHGAVVGFSAIRGISSLLSKTEFWKEFQLGAAPNQIFTWADANVPSQMHMAATMESPHEFIQQLERNFSPKANAWLANHALGSIAPLEGGGICWKDLPMIAPYLRVAKDKNQPTLEGGLAPNSKTRPDAPPEIYPRPTLSEHLDLLNSQTNLIAYEWETTGARAESIHTLGQLLRVIMRHPQMPAETGSSQWLFNARPRLANTTTLVMLNTPNTLKFERKSTVGFNALELHILADWLESPEFPSGFYSTLSPVGEALQPAGK